jgi:hypothetical protein
VPGRHRFFASGASSPYKSLLGAILLLWQG